MILESLVSLTLVVTAAAEPGVDAATGRAPAVLSAQQKAATLQPLLRSATECVVQAVANDPRAAAADDLRDLIVASMPACADRMRAMIDVHDRLYGAGSGEDFFMGPYLDTLPATVLKAVRDTAQ